MSSPIERLDREIKVAMLAKDHIKLNTLRMLKTALQYYQIEKKIASLSENDLISVVQKQIKQHLDSIESYRSAGRDDLFKKEEAELVILKTYVPQALSSEDLKALVKTVIAEVGATSKAQMGLVMKTALVKAAGRADGKTINALVLKLLPS